MARPIVACPACRTPMLNDDCIRVSKQWVDVYACPRCGQVKRIAQQPAQIERESPPTERAPRPEPVPVETPPPVREVRPEPIEVREAVNDVPRPEFQVPCPRNGHVFLETLLERAMIWIADEDEQSRQEIESTLRNNAHWTARKMANSASFDEYPLA